MLDDTSGHLRRARDQNHLLREEIDLLRYNMGDQEKYVEKLRDLLSRVFVYTISTRASVDGRTYRCTGCHCVTFSLDYPVGTHKSDCVISQVREELDKIR